MKGIETARQFLRSIASCPGDLIMRSTAERLERTSKSGAYPEGPVATAIEHRTAQLPSDVFLWAAAGAAVCSLGLQVAGEQKLSNFVGQWTPTILIMGLYNKLVKLHGSDADSRTDSSDGRSF
jgi:hypothetical protein